MANNDVKELLSWGNLDTLNKFIRLANITGLSFVDLNTLLTGWEELRNAYPDVKVERLLEQINTMLESAG